MTMPLFYDPDHCPTSSLRTISSGTVAVEELSTNVMPWPSALLNQLQIFGIRALRYLGHGESVVAFEPSTDYADIKPTLLICRYGNMSSYSIGHPCILPAMDSVMAGNYIMRLVPMAHVGTETRMQDAKELADIIHATSQVDGKVCVIADDLDRPEKPSVYNIGNPVLMPQHPFVIDWGSVNFAPGVTAREKAALTQKWETDLSLAPWREARTVIAPTFASIRKRGNADPVKQLTQQAAYQAAR